MQTRLRRASDEDAFVELSRRFIEEQHPYMTFSEHSAREAFRVTFEDPALSVYVAESERKLIGFVLASMSRMVFTSSACAMTSTWFVAPEFRDTDAERMLLAEFDAWARRQGAVETIFAAPEGVGGLAATRFATGAGYMPVGGLMGRATGAGYVS